MILRLLAFALAVYLVYRLIRWGMDILASPKRPSPGPPPDQPIVPCKACGTFIPRDEADVDDRGHIFCSTECRADEPH